MRYFCSFEVCSEFQFLLNIQFRRCKLEAIILFYYLEICKSHGKRNIGHTCCALLFLQLLFQALFFYNLIIEGVMLDM